jgi:Phosphate transport (Pho88)
MRSNLLFWTLFASTVLRQSDSASIWRRSFGAAMRPLEDRRSAIERKSSPLWKHHWKSAVSVVPRGGTSQNDDDDEQSDHDTNEMNDDSIQNHENIVEQRQTEISKNDNDEDSLEDEDDGVDEDDEEEEDETENNGSKLEIDGVKIELNVEKYDEPYFASPMSSLYASLGVMLLARKVDLFHPAMVRIARFIFIAYVILHQCFLFYVRIQVKQNNDRTPIELKNPLSSLLQTQLGGPTGGLGGNSMMKSLASSFLSSQSTVLDYDLKEVRGMQSSLIFNMLFMWFLHFKMQQVQPLFIQSVNGLMSMVYSPLFQAYVLRRNLERPFKKHAPMLNVDEQLTTDVSDDKNSGKTSEVIPDENDSDDEEEEIALYADDDVD